jgi:hypothetical protein
MADEMQIPEECGCLGQATHEAEDRIRRQFEVNVAYYARRLDRIEERLRDLEREWDIERAVAVGAGVVTLAGLALGLIRRRWVLLSAGAAVLLIAHSTNRCCEPPVLRCLGVRTRREIEQERYALKALRGDFSAVKTGPDADPEANATGAIGAVDRE